MVLVACLHFILQWLVPRVLCQGVFGVVNGDNLTGVQVGGFLAQLLGQGVDAFPLLVVLAVFKDGQVYIRVIFPYFFEMRSVAAVAADEDVAVRGVQQKRCPKGVVAFQCAAGKVLRGQAKDAESVI